MHTCYNCGAVWESTLRQPSVKETCEACGAYLHCCRNCTHHRCGYPNECYIPDTDKIADKSHTNFCDEFEFVSEDTLRQHVGSSEKPRETLDALLGESPALESHSNVKDWLGSADKPKQEFDDLFSE